MTRNLRHDLKRVAAGVCALMLVSGTVPVQPIADLINTAIVASAEGEVNLSTLGSYTAQDGDVLTGSTSGTVTIANNANITLNNATITGGIICEGSATITLVGTNSVSGANEKAGIQIGGSGTTLTIKGDGSLTSNGGYWSAGIGLSAIFNYDNNVSSGDIIIESGTITAIGGNWGAGIGTGVIKNTNNDSSTSVQFGNVTIKGGTVTATGGDSGDGIGKGYSYPGPAISFGSVTIYDGIDRVDASSIKNSESVVYMHDETDVTANASNYFTITEDGNRRIIAQKDDTDYNVTIADDIEHGSVTADKTTAKAGELVTLTVAPTSGYGLQSLTVKDASDNDVSVSNRKFIMPKGGVTVSATFIQTTAAFDEATGVLTLNGNVDADEVKAYGAVIDDWGGIDKYSPVISVVCEPGTVLPADCSELFLNFYNTSDNLTIDLSNADVSGVTNMSKMFGGYCLTTIYVNSAWSMENVTSSDQMFVGCMELTGGNGTRWMEIENSNGYETAMSSTYAIIDGIDGQSGYLTHKKETPVITTAPSAKTDLVYNGEAQALIEGGSTTGGTMQYSLDGETFSTKIPEATNAGDYTVYYKVIGDENYNSTDVKTVEVTIARADLPVTVTGYEGTFDGNAHGISVDVGNSDAIVYYAKSAINADNYAEIGSTESPSFTNAGSYRVYYYVTTGNYDPDPVSGSILVTIKKADAPVLTDDQKPTPVDKLVYTGEALDLVTAPESIPDGYSIRYSINGGAWISTLPTAIESGTYTVAYKYVENTNYKDIAGETFTITVKDKYSEPMWVWADDYSSATATFIKNDNSSEPIILDAEVTFEVVSEPTYTEYGKTVYIATVKLEGKTYTYRKPVITAKLALTHVEAVPATCDEAGNIEYWFDAENEKYFADDKGENEITMADTIVAPIDHAYGAPQWIWNAENAATATFKCANCGDEQTINAVVTAEVTAPTYTKNGKTVYTATVDFDGKTYTDTLTVTIGKKAYTAPAISYLKGDGAVKLSWNAIEGAERYAIAGFIDGKWKLLNRTEDTSFIIDNLNPGEQYKVAVVAMFDGEYIMDFSNAITVTPKPAQEVVYPKITEIEYNEQYHQFKLNWTEVPNAQNYGIAVYLAGKWKIQTQTIPATTTSFTSPKLKAGQTYKMIVCAKVNGKWDLSALSSRAFEVTVK